jgi:5-methylthioadenosine/S-adenosylhomocysteine deaminase
MAVAGPQYSTPDVAVADLRAAAERDLIASMHQSGGPPAAAWETVCRAELFGPRSNVVHGVGLSDDWVAALVEAGVSFTATPENELGHGHGIPITGQLLRLGAAPSLGTDTETAISGEILTAARIALAHQRGLDHEQHRQATGLMSTTASVTSKQALSWATVEGARALGLVDRVGRLEPGMQADLIVIDARALNLWPAHDPIAAALHAGVADIEAVMIAGRWRKRDHCLVDVDLDSVRSRLLESGERLSRHLNTDSGSRA